MRAGILSVARKALDGCSLMNTLAAQVAADLGYATEAGPEKVWRAKTNLVFVRKRTNGGENCIPTKRSKKDPSGGENLEFHSGTWSKSFPLKFGKIFICQFVSCVGIQWHWHRHHHTSTYLNTFAIEIDRRWRFLGAPHKIPWVKLIVHSYSRHGGCACCLAEKENHCRVVVQIPSGIWI